MELLYLAGALIAIFLLVFLFSHLFRAVVKAGIFLFLLTAASYFVLKFMHYI